MLIPHSCWSAPLCSFRISSEFSLFVWITHLSFVLAISKRFIAQIITSINKLARTELYTSCPNWQFATKLFFPPQYRCRHSRASFGFYLAPTRSDVQICDSKQLTQLTLILRHGNPRKCHPQQAQPYEDGLREVRPYQLQVWGCGMLRSWVWNEICAPLLTLFQIYSVFRSVWVGNSFQMVVSECLRVEFLIHSLNSGGESISITGSCR